jgi:urea transport system ATP-binding protein
VLTVTGLNQSYGGSHTLWDVDLVVPERSRTCLMGRNGMGKTTLLKCIMGLLPATSGHIAFAGTNLRSAPPDARARLGIGYVPQGREIFSRLTVEENLRVGLGVRTGGPRTIPPHVYDLFPALKQMLRRRGGDLSGGQQQQLAIARALVTQPKVLLLDEPTEGIQPSIIKDIARSLKEIRNLRKLTIIVSEQVLSFALDVADRLMVMDRGRLVHECTAAQADAKTLSAYLTV